MTKTRKKFKHKIKRLTRKNVYSTRNSYGEMILKKGTRLYHTSKKIFEYNPEKPMLFLTFHPSEWENEYITIIELKKDISLLFMVSIIENGVLQTDTKYGLMIPVKI